jgi:hypothetical protein
VPGIEVVTSGTVASSSDDKIIEAVDDDRFKYRINKMHKGKYIF